MRKPPNGLAQYVEYLARNEAGNSWTCQLCGHIYYGATIRECSKCGAFPSWRWTAPRRTIIKAWVCLRLWKLVALLRYALQRVEKRLDPH
jgi:ribosomal protein L37E